LLAWPYLSALGGLIGLIATGALATGVYLALLLVLGVNEARDALRLVRLR
jgi:hypothetical protein